MKEFGLTEVAVIAGVSVGTVSNYFNHPELVAAATAARIEAAVAETRYTRNRGRGRTDDGSTEVGIATVAEKAGVSVGTVSNFLNRPEILAPATARRVQGAIDSLNYVRNSAARNLRTGTSRAIGLLVLDIGNPFFTDLVKGVEEVAGAAGYAVLLGNTEEDPARELAYLELFQEQRVAGIIVSPAGDVHDRIRELQARGTAVVLIDEESHALTASSVSIDDFVGARTAVGHLLSTGRENIAFVMGPPRIHQVGARAAGAEDAMRAAGKSALLRVVQADSFSVDAGRQAGEQLLALPTEARPDAIFAANDLLALGVMQALFAAKVRIPEDIALIGYDDISYAAGAAIPLSSIRQPSREMGAEAARMMLRSIRDTGTSAREHVTFTPTLVVRASSSAMGGTPLPTADTSQA